jgi:hypothetical protein
MRRGPRALPLDAAQAEAVAADGHCLILACPGAGKTRTLAAKSARLLKAAPGARVCAVTFTREAAREIRARILQEAGEGAEGRVVAGTFHALCWRQLGGSREPVAGEGERSAYAARAAAAVRAELQPETALAIIEACKAGSPVPFPGLDTGRLLAAYQEILLRNGKIDFQDLVARALEGMRRGTVAPVPATHLLVDEFQDTDESQLAWVFAHARAGAQVTAVGDDDQSIYGWRRALGHEGMERFAAHLGAKRLFLGTNYRSRPEIVEAAARLIERNRGRQAKALRSARPPGGRVIPAALCHPPGGGGGGRRGRRWPLCRACPLEPPARPAGGCLRRARGALRAPGRGVDPRPGGDGHPGRSAAACRGHAQQGS